MNLIFFGNERLATGCTTKLPVLNALIKDGHEVELIVISDKDTKSRNKTKLEIVTFANQHNIELYIYQNTEDLLTKLKSVKSELAVLAAFGRIIKQEVIDSFKHGIINLHPSLLPKYRGPTPIESAILNGDNKTGVSIMSLTSGMDSGPIYSQVELKLSGKESKEELAHQLGELGAKQISKLLSQELPTPKDQTGEPTICNLIQKEDAELDLTKPADVLEREVRAYLGWPGTKTTLKLKNGKELQITITGAEVITEDDDSPLTFRTPKDYLRITKLKLPGKNEMTTKDFLNGYKSNF